jgi:hypothetical protein
VTTESYSETTQDIEPVKPANYFSVLGNIFFSPGKAFKEVGRSPLLLWPIIGLIIVGLLGGYVSSRLLDISSILTSQVDTAVAQGRMTQQQADQAMDSINASPIAKWAGYATVVTTPLGMLLMALVIAGVFKLISLFVSAENGFRGVFSATIFAMTPYYIVYYGLFAIIASFKDTSGLSATDLRSFIGSNLGALLGKDALPKFFMHMASFIDIFAIWEIALLSIGYAAVSKKLKTSTAAVWLSMLYLLIAIVVSAGQSMLGR